jgi:hypothetical protein
MVLQGFAGIPISIAKSDPDQNPAQQWTRCRHWLLAALHHVHGGIAEEDIIAALATGQLQLWSSGDAAIITEIVEYPRLKAVRLCLVGGQINGVRKLEHDICDWARKLGCKRVEGGGMQSWVKAVHGYLDVGPLFHKHL